MLWWPCGFSGKSSPTHTTSIYHENGSQSRNSWKNRNILRFEEFRLSHWFTQSSRVALQLGCRRMYFDLAARLGSGTSHWKEKQLDENIYVCWLVSEMVNCWEFPDVDRVIAEILGNHFTLLRENCWATLWSLQVSTEWFLCTFRSSNITYFL